MKLEKLKTFTLDWARNKTDIILAVVFGILAGQIILQLISLAGTNKFFIIGLPFVFIFALITVINMKLTLVILLFSRALLDPALHLTKVNVVGQRVGIGGMINVLVIIFAFFIFFKDPLRLIRNRLFKRWCIFLAVCFIATLYSPVPKSGLKLLSNLLTYMCISLIPFFVIEDMREQKQWIKILLLSSLPPVLVANFYLLRILGIFTSRLDEWLIGTLDGRIMGTFSHPNILAFYLVLVITLIFYVLKSKQFSLSRARANILRLYLLNVVILLLATKTRNAWISCWIVFLLYGLLKERKYILYVLAVPPLFLLNYTVWERIHELITSPVRYVPGSGYTSLTWRLELWKSSLPLIKKNLLFGHGLASFYPLSPKFFLLGRGEAVFAHNIYLELLFESGLLGIITYISIYFFALKEFCHGMKAKIVKTPVEYAIVFSYVASYLMACFADNMLYYLAFNWYFWFFIGIILRGRQLESADEKKYIDNNPIV